MELLRRHLIIIFMIVIAAAAQAEVRVGAGRWNKYLPSLTGKRVALYSNHTGVIPGDSLHILDRLKERGVDVRYVFSPEHGFRGDADAGAHVGNSRDARTGVKVLSLYGPGKKRALAAVDSVDVVVTDIQDVGLRFYTYYCTLVEMMNAATRPVEFIILDRPNPTAAMGVDGPVLDMKYASGVGRLPIPVLHGMTLGELMKMASGEGWLKDGRHPDITVVACEGWNRSMLYEPPIAPSPNLRSLHAILLYPSLCYFEATPLSVGRGTDAPFEVYGGPALTPSRNGFVFTPRPGYGSSNPPCNGKKCYGRDLRGIPTDTLVAHGIDLTYIIDAYLDTPKGQRERFFTSFMELLIGTLDVRQSIIRGEDASTIKARWQDGIADFERRRAKYLIYPER